MSYDGHRPITRAERQARERSLPKCRCGNTLSLGNTSGQCGSCEAREDAINRPFDGAKEEISDSGAFTPEQVFALHRMIDSLRP